MFLRTQDLWLRRLVALTANGLALEYELTLLRTWTQTASVHLIRHASVSIAWATEVDTQCVAAFEVLTRQQRQQRNTVLTEAQRAKLYLRLKDGGHGWGSTLMRRDAAWIGAWEGGFATLLASLGYTSV